MLHPDWRVPHQNTGHAALTKQVTSDFLERLRQMKARMNALKTQVETVRCAPSPALPFNSDPALAAASGRCNGGPASVSHHIMLCSLPVAPLRKIFQSKGALACLSLSWLTGGICGKEVLGITGRTSSSMSEPVWAEHLPDLADVGAQMKEVLEKYLEDEDDMLDVNLTARSARASPEYTLFSA